jgi:NAD-dependent SIR2 family protein deacetylase
MAVLRTCEHCGKTFNKRYFLAIKLGIKRLERCPHCHKFTDVYKKVPPPVTEERPEAAMTNDEVLRRKIEESKGEELR